MSTTPIENTQPPLQSASELNESRRQADLAVILEVARVVDRDAAIGLTLLSPDLDIIRFNISSIEMNCRFYYNRVEHTIWICSGTYISAHVRLMSDGTALRVGAPDRGRRLYTISHREAIQVLIEIAIRDQRQIVVAFTPIGLNFISLLRKIAKPKANWHKEGF